MSNQTLLVVDCCIRGAAHSRTYRLYQRFLQALEGRYEIQTVTLAEEDLRPYLAADIEKRNQLLQEGILEDPMFRYARQFAAADRILIAAPFWENTFPSLLRVYLEQVSVAGICFAYEDNHSVGKCQAEKLMYVTTVGGFPPHGSLMAVDFLKDLCDMFGIPEILSLSAEGLDIQGNDVEQILADCQPRIRELAKAF